VLYSFIKDALLSKVGIVKVWWETREERERETYLDLDEAAFAIISADPDVEIVAHSAHGGPAAAAGGLDAAGAPASAPLLHDVTVQTKRSWQCARVEGVPPEEFGIARNARSIRDTDYCFHDVLRSEAKLIAQGYDREQIKRIPSHIVTDTIEAHARDTVSESTLRQGDDGLNGASRVIRITEHYVRIDYEGDDKPRLYRVTTAGEDGEVLTRDGEPDVIQEDAIPFATMTPVIVTHRFFGRSIADLIMDIQRIKTALLRALLDNAYLANNPRTEVPESHASDTTLDDLLVSRPGGIVRTKMPGGLQVLQHPDVGAQVFPLLQYQDATREWRTGVSRQGQGIDPNALQNQVATIANQMFSASQAKVKLIARIFAETGIRDLFSLLHATIRKHGSQAQTVRLRNLWVTVDPRDWKKRDDMTINVALGTGTKGEQLANMQLIVGAQEKAIALGLVTPSNIYESAKELTKLAGHKDTARFFTAPDPNAANKSIPMPPDPKQTEIQAKAAAEQAKTQADAAHQQMKTQADIQLAQARFELDKQRMLLDAELKTREHTMEMARRAAEPGAPGPDGQPAPNHGALVGLLMDHLSKASAPKRARKLPDGSWVTEHVGAT
jgi:hypothetical protein